MRKNWRYCVLVLALATGLTGCGAAVPSEKTPENQTVQSVENGSDVRMFTDDCGRQVEIPVEITRIVPSAPLSQIILFAIAPEMFAGVASEWEEGARGIIADEYFDLPYFGSLYSSADLNVESLALTAPQLLIDVGESKKSVREDMDALQDQTGIPSVFISTTLETMPETYRKLGKLLGKEEKGEELAIFCERIYDRTLKIMEQVGQDKADVLYVLGQDGLNVLAKGSYHAEVLDMMTNNLAVVDNPLSKGTGNAVTMEQIALWDPEFVIFNPDSIYETVKEIPSWNQVDAIVNDRYVEVPQAPDNWMGMPPSVQRYLSLIWLPAILYPEYCDYDVKEEVREYYRLFYGCDLTEEQLEVIMVRGFAETRTDQKK